MSRLHRSPRMPLPGKHLNEHGAMVNAPVNHEFMSLWWQRCKSLHGTFQIGHYDMIGQGLLLWVLQCRNRILQSWLDNRKNCITDRILQYQPRQVRPWVISLQSCICNCSCEWAQSTQSICRLYTCATASHLVIWIHRLQLVICVWFTTLQA